MNDYGRKRQNLRTKEKTIVSSNISGINGTKSVNRKKRSDEAFKNALIIFLIVACLLQAIYIVFYTLNLKENSVKKSYLTFYIKAQKEVSTYLAETRLNTYEAYNYSQILTGTILNDEGKIIEIKDVDGNNISPIVDSTKKEDINGVEYYEINRENIKAQLKLEIPNYKNITWYLSSNGDVKVKCGFKPNWWTSDLDGTLLGN